MALASVPKQAGVAPTPAPLSATDRHRGRLIDQVKLKYEGDNPAPWRTLALSVSARFRARRISMRFLENAKYGYRIYERVALWRNHPTVDISCRLLLIAFRPTPLRHNELGGWLGDFTDALA
jgi:hypothetical protein